MTILSILFKKKRDMQIGVITYLFSSPELLFSVSIRPSTGTNLYSIVTAATISLDCSCCCYSVVVVLLLLLGDDCLWVL